MKRGGTGAPQSMKPMPRHLSALLCQCSWYVWREWIWNHFPLGWRYNQIHVFHLNGAEQHLISQDDGTAKTAAIPEYDLHWADIRDNVPLAIRCGHFSLVNLLQFELGGDMLGDT